MESKDTTCPACGKYSFQFSDDYDICPICDWENDGLQRARKDYWGGANSLSVNEAKHVYVLSQNEATKIKVTDIVEKYNLTQREIHFKYREIDHTTSEGQNCREAFTKAHNDFIIELYKLVGTQK